MTCVCWENLKAIHCLDPQSWKDHLLCLKYISITKHCDSGNVIHTTLTTYHCHNIYRLFFSLFSFFSAHPSCGLTLSQYDSFNENHAWLGVVGGGGVWRHEIKLNWLPGFLEKKRKTNNFPQLCFWTVTEIMCTVRFSHCFYMIMWEIPFGLHLHECSRPYSQRCSVWESHHCGHRQ